jgi:hypothetical protein
MIYMRKAKRVSLRAFSRLIERNVARNKLGNYHIEAKIQEHMVWTHPKIRKSIVQAFDKRLFFGTAVNEIVLSKIYLMKSSELHRSILIFARESGIPQRTVEKKLKADLKKVIRRSEALMHDLRVSWNQGYSTDGAKKYLRGKTKTDLNDGEKKYLAKKEKVNLGGTRDVYLSRFDRAALDSIAQFLTVRYNCAVHVLDMLKPAEHQK